MPTIHLPSFAVIGCFVGKTEKAGIVRYGGGGHGTATCMILRLLSPLDILHLLEAQGL
jgi:hypothetical protein